MYNALKTFFILPFMLIASTSYAVPQTTVDIGIGYRRDAIHWNLREKHFKGEMQEMDSRSRVRLEDIDIVVLSGKLRAMDCFYYFRVQGDYGWICHGKAKDRFRCKMPYQIGGDHHGRSNDSIDGDYVADIGTVIGYPFFWGCNCYMLAPWIGYSYHTQKFCVHNDKDKKFHKKHEKHGKHGKVTDDDKILPLDEEILPLSHRGKKDLDFQFRWYGPIAGFDVAVALEDCWSLYGEFTWLFATQVKRKRDGDIKFAYIDENGQEHHDFDSKDRHDNGWGFTYEVGANYFTGCWYLGVKTGYRWFKSDCKKKDDVRLRSWDIQAVAGYVF